MKSRRASSSLESVLDSLSSPIRLAMLKSLAYQKLGYSELAKAVGMDRSKDAGKFSYHLKKLLNSGLIEVDSSSGKYALSQRGALVLKYLEKIEEELGERTLMIVRRSDQLIEPFDKNKIADALVKEAKLSPKLAKEIAAVAERKLLDLKIDYLTAPLIRELVNSILLDMGLEKYRHRLTRLGMPLYDAEKLLKKSVDSGDWRIFLEEASGAIEKEYLLLSFLPREVAELHLSGRIDIYPISNWLTGFFSKEFDLDSENLFENSINIAFKSLSIRHELKLSGSDEKIRQVAQILLKRLPKKRILSLKLSESILELVGKTWKKLGHLGLIVNLKEFDLRELARLSRNLVKLDLPHVYSLSDDTCFSGFLLSNSRKGIHSVTTLNVLGIALESGGDLDLTLRKLSECIKEVIPVMKKGLKLVEKIHGENAVYSIISLSGVFEASRYLARGKSIIIEEALDIASRIVAEARRILSQLGGGKILLGGRCPTSAAKRFFRIDSYRYGEEAVGNLLEKRAQYYSVTPFPGVDRFRSPEDWVEASKKIIGNLDAGCFIPLRGEKGVKALKSVLPIAEKLRKINENSVIAFREH